MNKIKSLKICSPQLGLSPYSTLGGEVYDVEVLSRMSKLGSKILVLLPKNRPYPNVNNLKVTHTFLKHIFPPYIYSIIMIPYLLLTYKREKFDVLRIHVPHFLAFGAILFKLVLPKVTLITHYHLDETGKLTDIINNIFFKFTNHVIADSNFLKNRLEKKFPFLKSKITVVHTGVDDKKIYPLKKDFKLTKKYGLENKIVLLFLGRLIKRKNPLFLIKLIEKLPNNVSLILIGSGSEEKLIKKEIKKNRLEKRVILAGPRFGFDKLKHYSVADIFVFPSLNEGFVLAVLEGMAAGLPLVLPNSGAFPEAVKDGLNGYLAKPNNLDDWVKKINYLSKNSKLRKDMGEKSRQRVLKEFTWDIVAEENLKIYRRVTDGKI